MRRLQVLRRVWFPIGLSIPALLELARTMLSIAEFQYSKNRLLAN
jgi:hypothetical protein